MDTRVAYNLIMFFFSTRFLIHKFIFFSNLIYLFTPPKSPYFKKYFIPKTPQNCYCAKFLVMQVKGALWFPIINTPVPPPLRPQRLTPLPFPSLTPRPPFPSTLQHPIMSSWCKWLDEKRLFTASLYMHVQKKKQVKWAQSTQRWGVGFESEGSKKNTIYRLLTASLFTCT